MFGFGEWSDGELRDRFVSIMGEGQKNNTYKFAWARFLLDHACDPHAMPRMYGRIWDRIAAKPAGASGGSGRGRGGGDRVTYAEIALYFFAYYWPLVRWTRLRQGPDGQKPKAAREIEREFGDGERRRPLCQIICEEPERVECCLRKIARVGFKDVVHRFQWVCGKEARMFYQYAAGPGDKSGNRRIDPGGGILVNGRAARFLRDNYAALSRAVALEWLLATASFSPGAPDLAGRFAGAYGECESACRFLLGLENEGRTCFYCGARPGRDERMCVDHFLPAGYVGGIEPWNLVLACQECRREKDGMLPPRECIGKLEHRNAKRREDEAPAVPLCRTTRLERELGRHYEIAKSRGYPVAESLQNACR